MAKSARPYRIQVHLSTAVWLSLAAGVLMWANTCEQTIGHDSITDYYIRNNMIFKRKDVHRINATAFGWPSWAVRRSIESVIESTKFKEIDRGYYVDYFRIGLNFIIAMLILFVLWFVLEWRVQQQELRKEA